MVCLVASPAAARAQVFITPNIVISQIYTHGGEPCATFQSDYVELFNRGSANIDINGFALQTTTGNGNFRRRGAPAGPTTRCRQPLFSTSGGAFNI